MARECAGVVELARKLPGAAHPVTNTPQLRRINMTTTDPTLDVTLELITPELAVSYLENNTDNRAVTQNTVTALAELIRKGEWRITHQGIAVSPTGRLLDGQHRLWAIIEAGIPVHILVARNVPDEAFAYMDIGKKRSLADRLRLDRTVAEVVRLATAMVFGNGFSANCLRELM